jgi:hypothetical protein
MNLKKIKYSKIAVVVFLTALIWIWADLATDTEHVIPRTTIRMGISRPELWISFAGETAVDINNVTLKGPVSKVNEAKSIIGKDPQKLEFILDNEQQERYGWTKQGTYELNVQDFFRNYDWIHQLGLSVPACEPNVVYVNVVELVERQLTVRVQNQDGNFLEPETIVPSEVEMYVPQDWFGEKLTAYVVLSNSDIKRARSEAISKIPYIVLATGQSRQAPISVMIKMPLEEDPRVEYTIPQPILGFCYSDNTQGKYTAEVENLNQVLSFTVKATEAAKQAYENMPFQVTLIILDGDVKSAEEGLEIQRDVIYNFPEEFVRRNEIELMNPNQRTTATFKLVPVAP